MGNLDLRNIEIPSGTGKKVIIGAGALFVLIVLSLLFKVVSIEGNYMGVKESWMGGVEKEPLMPKTYFLFPGFMYSIYKYDMSSRVFVMNDTPSRIENIARGRELDSYLVQSKEGQDMHVSMNIRWRLDPTKLIEIHKMTRESFEEKLIRPVMLRVVKDQSTQRTAIEAYSGDGLVKLQRDIEHALMDEGSELRQRGVIVENFVIEGIGLDPQYIGEIKSRQVATQKELRAKAEELAAIAQSKQVKAEAQADFERTVVQAERDKQVGILKAEKEAQQQILGAEAAKKQVVLAAEGEKDASVLRAQAVIAMGEADASAKKAQLAAYAVSGADAFVKIEVSKNLSEAFKNIQGYLPSDMHINLLSDSFMKSVENLMGKKTATD